MIYVTSDIHGNMPAFERIIRQISLFDDDILYILGDAVDRHPDGIKLLEYVMDKPNVKMLLGNHEKMMLDAVTTGSEAALTLWYMNGGDVTHFGFLQLLEARKEKIITFLKSLPVSFSLEVDGKKFLLVHAAPPCNDNEARLCYRFKSGTERAIWDRDYFRFSNETEPDTTVILGHIMTEHYDENGMMEILQIDNKIDIDCGAGLSRGSGGRLACVRLDDMKVFYSDYWK